MQQHHWKVRPKLTDEARASFPELSRVLATLLYQRELTAQEDIDAFLEPEYSHDLHDPFLFRDMQKAVDRIVRALEKKEKITVFGDYDADGVCGASVLYCTLREFHANLDVYIPYRMTEGYGMNINALEEIAKGGSTLIITNDLGITNTDEVAFANAHGMDVIVSDHHHEPEHMPDAYAILNPMVSSEPYPYKGLAGTGVSFKLATALLLHTEYGKAFRDAPLPTGWEKWLLDLVAIGTVADIMPLLGENRALVYFGLSVLQKTRRPGLLALAQEMRRSLQDATTQTIGFAIAPRLNAAGRLKHASTAFGLLSTEDTAEAAALAHELEQTNRERQRLSDAIAVEAMQQIGTPQKDAKLVVAVGEGWQRGVVGIVAGKLVQHYGIPAIVAGVDGTEVHGSGRSVSAFNMIEAVTRCAAVLSKYGGHAQACGFTAPDRAAFDVFAAQLTLEAEQALAGKDLRAELPIDLSITIPEITWELVDDLARLEPFGEANARPRFLIANARLADFSAVGSDGKHLRLTLEQNGVHRKAIAFRKGEHAESLHVNDMLDVVAEVEKNEWNGNQEIQLSIIDLRHHE